MAQRTAGGDRQAGAGDHVRSERDAGLGRDGHGAASIAHAGAAAEIRHREARRAAVGDRDVAAAAVGDVHPRGVDPHSATSAVADPSPGDDLQVIRFDRGRRIDGHRARGHEGDVAPAARSAGADLRALSPELERRATRIEVDVTALAGIGRGIDFADLHGAGAPAGAERDAAALGFDTTQFDRAVRGADVDLAAAGLDPIGATTDAAAGGDGERRTGAHLLHVQRAVVERTQHHVAARLELDVAAEGLERALRQGCVGRGVDFLAVQDIVVLHPRIVAAGLAALVDGDVLRIEQQQASPSLRCRGVHVGAEDQRVLAGCLHGSAVASVRSAPGLDPPAHAGDAVGPHDDGAAVPAFQRIGQQAAAGLHRGGLSVGDPDVAALPATANERFPAAGAAAHVDHGPGLHDHLARARVQGAALVAAHGRGPAGDLHRVGGGEHDLAAAGRCAAGPDQASVLELRRKDPDRIAFERAQIQCAVVRRLHLQPDAFEPSAREFHLLACRDDRRTIRGKHKRRGAHLHLRRDQHHVAAAREHLPVDLHDSARGAVAAEHQPAGQGVGVAHAQRGRREAGRIHHRTRADGDARRIHHHQPAIGTKRPEDRGGVMARHAIDRRARGVGLAEVGDAAAGHRKALPVDGGVSGSRPVARRDDERLALLLQAGLAVNHLRTGRLRQHVAERQEDRRQRERHARWAKPGRDRVMRMVRGGRASGAEHARLLGGWIAAVRRTCHAGSSASAWAGCSPALSLRIGAEHANTRYTRLQAR